MPNKFKEYTIHEITKEVPRNIEKITPTHTLPPSRTDARDTQYATRLTTNPAQRGLTKGEAADEHRTRVTQISQEDDYIITYTDGSMKEKDQGHRTGAGWVVYWKGMERRCGCEGMGRLAEVYDAEMLALLRGLETAIEFQQEMPIANRRRARIVLFADNTASVSAITKETSGSSQQTSQKFVETAITFLDKNRRATIEVSWVPGHMSIEGNDRADEIAKGATDLEPAIETATLAKLYRQLFERLKTEWISSWANKPMTGRYAIADHIPPSLAGSHAFRTLNRHTLGVVTQTRTGHGYSGEYNLTHNTQEPSDCSYGAELQTRDHVLFECETHEERGHSIDEGAPGHKLATILRTKKGIDALAKFVRESKAFQKQKAEAIL